MKSNPIVRWIIFFPAILIAYLLESFISLRILMHSFGNMSATSFWDDGGDKIWETFIYALMLPIIAGYLLARLIYYLCPNPQLGAKVIAGLYIFYAGSIYLKPKVWNIGSLSALWYDGVILCFLIYVSFEKTPSQTKIVQDGV